MLTFVATILTESNSVGKPWRPQFEASCQRHELEANPLRLKEYNPCHGNLKLKALAAACVERRHTHTHVLYVDGFDLILLDGLAELERRFLAFNRPMVVAGASSLVPKLCDTSKFPFAESGSPFRFPRAGIFMAELPYFLQLVARHGLYDVPGPFIDNEWFQHVYATAPASFMVDIDTEMFITLDGASPGAFEVAHGRVVNTVTQSKPSIIHAAGRFNFAPVLQQLVTQGHYYLGDFRPSLSQAPVVAPQPAARISTRPRDEPVRREWLGEYAKAWKDQSAVTAPLEPGLVSLLKPYRGHTALDYGAGAGRWTGQLLTQFSHVVAVDVSAPALQLLRAKYPTVRIDEQRHPALTAVHADEVDFILAWDVLSYVDFFDLQYLLREFHRVLKPGGQLLANFNHLKSSHNLALLNGFSPQTGPAQLRPYTRETLSYLLKLAGFNLHSLTADGPNLVAKAQRRHAIVSTQKVLVRNFYHSGDAGDVIYSLPTIKALGGGRLYLGGQLNIKYDATTRLKMGFGAFENLRGLLEAQPYVHSCCFADVFPDGVIHTNLNEFRVWLIDHQTGNYWNQPDYEETLSIAKVHLETFGVQGVDETVPWLEVEPLELPTGRDIVVARSLRYNNLRFPWAELTQRLSHRMCFVGLDDEYEAWLKVAGRVELPRLATKTLLEAARYIASAKLFIGNQSCPFALAEGLKRPAVQETWDHDPNCMFNRPTALYQCEDFATIMRFATQFLET